MSFKLKPTSPGTAPRKAPEQPVAPRQVKGKSESTGKDVQRVVHEGAEPDGSAAGALRTKTGERVYQEEVLWPPAKPPEHHPMKLKGG